MANRANHYEAAFEEYLRWRGDAVRGGGRVAAEPDGRRGVAQEPRFHRLLVGLSDAGWSTSRGAAFRRRRAKQYWKNWSTHDDLESLARWEAMFGVGFRGLFVFAYNIVGDRAPLPKERLFEHRGALYAFLAVPLGDYAACCRRISIRWDTVAMPTADFRRLARHVDEFLDPPST